MSPSPTSSPTPTETQLERQARLDFEAAEKAYRTFNGEFVRLSHAGGSPAPTHLMQDTAGGPYLAAYSKVLGQQYDIGAKTHGAIVIRSVQRQNYLPGRITITSCEDASSFRTYDKTGRPVDRGGVALMTIEARAVGSRWKLWDFNDKDASKCAS